MGKGGAGVVHVTGATAALVAKIFYNGGKESSDKNELSNLKEIMTGAGYFAATIGFIALNCGAEKHIFRSANIGTFGVVAINTIISAATCGILVALLTPVFNKKTKTNLYLKTISGGISGMVASSASSSDIHPWFAFLIGSFAALLFILVWSALTIIKVDDDKDIIASHLGGGFAGVVLSPVLRIKLENSDNLTGDLTSYTAVLWNFVGVCAIFVWTTFLSALCFWFCSKFRNHQFFISKEKFNKNENCGKKETESHGDEDTIEDNEEEITLIENKTTNENVENELADPKTLIKEKEKIEKLKLHSKRDPKSRKDSDIPSTSKLNTIITEDFLRDLKDSLAPMTKPFQHLETSKTVDLNTTNSNEYNKHDLNENCLDKNSLSQSVSQIKLSFQTTKKLPSTKLVRAPSIPRNLPEKFSVNSISLKQTNSLIKYLVSQQSSKIDVDINNIARKSIGDFVVKSKLSSQVFDDCNEVEDLKIDSRERKVSLSSFLNKI